MGDYDIIIKQNIEAIFLPLLEKLTGIRINDSWEIKDKVQQTIEREPDFLKRIIDQNGDEFILQLEFQTTSDKEMVYRMAEYKAILQRKYQIPIRQYVIYLGTGSPQMITELPKDQQIRGFELRSLQDIPVGKMLDSKIPSEVIISILTDFPKNSANDVIESIISRLQETTKNEIELRGAIQQLLILSRLRNLELITKNKVDKMPITYDITKDGLYLEGIEQGKSQIVKKALKIGKLSVQEIAEMADVSVDFVLDLQAQKN